MGASPSLGGGGERWISRPILASYRYADAAHQHSLSLLSKCSPWRAPGSPGFSHHLLFDKQGQWFQVLRSALKILQNAPDSPKICLLLRVGCGRALLFPVPWSSSITVCSELLVRVGCGQALLFPAPHPSPSARSCWSGWAMAGDCCSLVLTHHPLLGAAGDQLPVT